MLAELWSAALEREALGISERKKASEFVDLGREGMPSVEAEIERAWGNPRDVELATIAKNTEDYELVLRECKELAQERGKEVADAEGVMWAGPSQRILETNLAIDDRLERAGYRLRQRGGGYAGRIAELRGERHIIGMSGLRFQGGQQVLTWFWCLLR